MISGKRKFKNPWMTKRRFPTSLVTRSQDSHIPTQHKSVRPKNLGNLANERISRNPRHGNRSRHKNTFFVWIYIFVQKDVLARALLHEAEHIGKGQIIVSLKNVECDLSLSRGEEKQETAAGCGGVSEDSH